MHPKPDINVKKPLSGNICTRLKMYWSNFGSVNAKGLSI